MPAAKRPVRYLETHGPKLLDAGYNIIPIASGAKVPPFKEWQQTRATHKVLQGWIDQGLGGCGVGILTLKTPLVDVDVYDADLVDYMRGYVGLITGADAPERVGRKGSGLLFQVEEPFVKVQSARYLDAKGRSVKCEVLGDGQQFVAYHLHPDTKQPYKWYGSSPLKTPAADLPFITHDDAMEICAEFDRQARARGWAEASSLKRLNGTRRNIDHDDPFITDKPRVDMSRDELRARLMLIADASDYDLWSQIGMALYHQFEGDEAGLELWHEWSQTAENYDHAALEAKWPTFEIEGKGREPVTARLILQKAKESEKKLATETFAKLKEDLRAARDTDAITAVCDQAKVLPLDKLTRETFTGLVREQYKLVTHQTLTISAARDMTRYANPSYGTLPFWLENWVYCKHDSTFFSLKTHEVMSKEAFNDSMGRFLLTPGEVLEGKAVPEVSPASVALNRYQIQVVQNRMYHPAIDDDIFSWDGNVYVNTYSNRGIPTVPDKLSAADLRNIERVKGHFAHLFADERDRRLLIDWMSYIVATGQRVSWAPIIQGTQNDGKTFFFKLLQAVLGPTNARTIMGDALTEKYNAWAEGHQVVFIEEVRLAGKDRYAIINKLKPNITNDDVPIRRMNTDTYTVLNTTSYLMSTNYRDAMPIGQDETRYFPMFSRFQTQEALLAFNRANPRYYDDLYAALQESPGALRKWLLEHERSDEFEPRKRAPRSSHRHEMIYLSASDEQEALEEILATSPRMDLTKELLNATALADEMAGMEASAPYGKAMKQFLSKAGFTPLGKIRIGGDYQRFWSQKPELFRGPDGEVDKERIRNYLEEEL